MTTSNDLDTVSHSWDGHFEQNGLPSQAQIQVAEASTAQKAAPAAAEPVPVDVGSGAPVKPEAPRKRKHHRQPRHTNTWPTPAMR
ncbi:hypothetical protein ACVDG5_032980 [Mesorhizobium sp. ORM6]